MIHVQDKPQTCVTQITEHVEMCTELIRTKIKFALNNHTLVHRRVPKLIEIRYYLDFRSSGILRSLDW
jgi:hypothetical protein